jgi:hypothetical protein
MLALRSVLLHTKTPCRVITCRFRFFLVAASLQASLQGTISSADCASPLFGSNEARARVFRDISLSICCVAAEGKACNGYTPSRHET